MYNDTTLEVIMMSYEVGFTGTRQRVSEWQCSELHKLLQEREVKKIHLGDCVGADAEAHYIATMSGIYTIGHPPINKSLRAFKTYDEERPPKPYLVRNEDIVEESRWLIAMPKSRIEERRSGTWATIRYARNLNREIIIIALDGVYTDGKGTT